MFFFILTKETRRGRRGEEEKGTREISFWQNYFFSEITNLKNDNS
jgi:hypothetical protein